MASSTADLLLGKIVSILENEVFLVRGIRDEINKIKHELEMMKSFLEDADQKGVHSETENAWVSNVRDLAYEVEDIIDKYMYNVNKQQQWRSTKYIGFFLKATQYPQNLLLQRQVAIKLQDVFQRIKNVAETNQRYGFYHLEGKDNKKVEGLPSASNYDPNWVKNHNESALFLKDDDLVGFTKEKKRLLAWLLDNELQRSAISVVGMGGLGKTTLVANTFNKQPVKKHFDCYAWITVSQQYRIEELLRTLIKQISKKANEEIQVNLNTMAYRELVEKLVEYLGPKRYLIVLDDVWSISLWKAISVALPNRLNGSRVMLTTRVDEVASYEYGVVNYTLPLKPLTAYEARKLFCMRAFPSKGGQCPQYLNYLATNLVERCGGLPLAIVALGGLMSSKKSIKDWELILNNLNWELSNNPELEAVKCISLLSYHHLPHRLKHCFLYCCLFPEDYPFRRNRLIRLWMAEGFVEPVKGATPEEVAERYLMELISRGLLQVAQRSASGRPQKCKMHDILRELADSISETENFIAKVDATEAKLDSNGIRRLSIEAKHKEMKSTKGISQLRSFFVFPVLESSESSSNGLPFAFKMLRVLDLEDAPIDQLPDELVNLFNLRYLNLTRTRVKELPTSIGKLCNLLSLLLVETQIRELPPGVVKLKNLRHLIVYRSDSSFTSTDYQRWLGTCTPSNLFLLRSLQVLTLVEAGEAFIKDLSKMTQLKRLCISNIKEANERDFCFSIGKLTQLRYLLVTSGNEDELLKMDALISPPVCLEKLYLYGKLDKLPHWFSSLRNLTNLRLHWSKLREDFLAHIQALPNLRQLTLVNACEGGRLLFLEGFQKLNILRIWRCPLLKKIVINQGVMPGLQQLDIRECQELLILPNVRWNLPDLKEVYLEQVPSEIIQKTCGEVDDVEKIRAIELSRDVDEPKSEWGFTIWDY